MYAIPTDVEIHYATEILFMLKTRKQMRESEKENATHVQPTPASLALANSGTMSFNHPQGYLRAS